MAQAQKVQVQIGVQSFKRIAWKVFEVKLFTQVGDERKTWTYHFNGKRDVVAAQVKRLVDEAGERMLAADAALPDEG